MNCLSASHKQENLAQNSLASDDLVQSSTKHPLWSPLSASGKPSTRPPYLISFTPYTTPTPLPKRPDWKHEDWIDYFKENHPNFWFQKNLRKKVMEKLNSTPRSPKENQEDKTG